jgi:hypothetical protein
VEVLKAILIFERPPKAVASGQTDQ